MKHWKLQSSALVAAALLCMPASAENLCSMPMQGQSASSIPATQGKDRDAGRAERELLYQWLNESHGSPHAATISVPLTRQNRIDLGLEECRDCLVAKTDPRKLRVGVNKSVGHVVNFSGLPVDDATRAPVAFAGGRVQMTADGPGWAKTVTSPEATAVRLMLRDVRLPDDAVIFVYNDRGEAFGPYFARQGELWTNTVTGDAITVVVQFFGETDRSALARTRMEIAEIVHLGPDFRLAAPSGPEPQSSFGHCSFNESCVDDASCYDFNDYSYIDDARMATGHLLFSSGPWAFLCSGGLLADTAGSEVPYFITANHCISRKREANSLETYFQYMTLSCGGICPDRGDFPRTLGSQILSTSSSSDYTLLLLEQQPPDGSVFLGWTSTEVAFTPGYELFRISHPNGAPQAFSTHVVDTGAPICSSWPRGPWIYSDDVVGATEGGSSGSPVLNAGGQVVGLLSGACGFNVNDVCDSESNATVDGALAYFFEDISHWLAPDNDDPDPGDPVEDGTLSVSTISLSVRAQGPWRTGQASVTIRDDQGNAVGGATVTGTFSGDVGGSDTITTDSDGNALLRSSRVRQNAISFSFCVDSVTHPDFDYDATGNAVTCVSQ